MPNDDSGPLGASIAHWMYPLGSTRDTPQLPQGCAKVFVGDHFKRRVGSAMIKGVLLDLSGVLYVGKKPLPGAHEALRRLVASGLPTRFVTNTTRSPRNAILAKLAGMQFRAADDTLFTAPQAALAYIEQQDLHPYLLIHPDLQGEFPQHPHEAWDSVLVGDAGAEFTYHNLNTAFRIVIDGAPLLAMGYSRYFKESQGLSLDIGPFVAALEFAADVRAKVLGKPAPEFFEAAVSGLGCEPEQVVMVGDDAQADVGGAIAAGLQGVLVRTGKYRPGDEDSIEQPSVMAVDDITAAVEWILDHRA
jgi:HAD superfamily hydrolase (TIGR01458 family)